MSAFYDNVIALLAEKGITKSKLLKDLGLNRNSFVDWKNRGNIPSAEKVSAIAEYLEVPIGYLLGVEKDDDEQAKSPNEKLAVQMAYHCVTLSELSKALAVPEEGILKWLTGETEFSKYYDRLSEIFEIAPTYWVRPGMISPGIEPTIDEYMLILLYRNYRQTGELHEDIFGNLRKYFPAAFTDIPTNSDLTGEEKDLIECFRKMSKYDRYVLLGDAAKLSRKSTGSVAADPAEAPAKMAK